MLALPPVCVFMDLPQGLAKFLSGQYGTPGGLGLQNLGGNDSIIIHMHPMIEQLRGRMVHLQPENTQSDII